MEIETILNNYDNLALNKMNTSNRAIITELKDHLVKNFGNSIDDDILFESRTRSDFNQYYELHTLKHTQLIGWSTKIL